MGNEAGVELGDFAPDVFVLGAPKCGTTALYDLLQRHPAINDARFKEPHFFATDMPEHRTIVDPAAYRALFAQPGSGRPSVEGSVWYLYSHDAVPNILRCNPHARFIVMFRRQDQMLPSLWKQFRYVFKEDATTFEAAWDLRFDRERGERIPDAVDIPGQLEYHRVGRFGEQLKRLYDVAPAESVHVVFFEDLRADSAEVASRVLDFIGLEASARAGGPVEIEHVNGRKEHRFPALAKQLMRPSGPLAAVKSRVRSVAPMLTKEIGRKLYAGASASAGRPEISARVLTEVRETYRDDVELLARLAGRDLQAWTCGG